MIRAAALLLVFGVAIAGAPPAYFKLPPPAAIDLATLVDENYGEAHIPNGVDDPNVKRGHHWSFVVRVPDIDDTKDGSGSEAWKRLQPALTASGWVLRNRFDTNPLGIVMALQKPPVDALVWMQFFSSTDIRVEVIENKAFTPTFTLTPPAAKPETVSETQSYPYLRPMGNATLNGTRDDDGALYVHLKGDDQPTLISPRSIRKDYTGLSGISNLQFVLEYGSALTKAGWEVVSVSQGLNQSDAVVEAHYAKTGRDIWTSLHYGGEELRVTVADLTMDLAAMLNKECRVPMYGITFDFNKATLRPEAESTLQNVLAALQRDTALAIEVQGHTDNVGGDQYNLTLSQARAETVRTWLAGHGIAAARLAAKGYGRNQPIADNDTDEGRAKNRRVVLQKTGCQK